MPRLFPTHWYFLCVLLVSMHWFVVVLLCFCELRLLGPSRHGVPDFLWYAHGYSLRLHLVLFVFPMVALGPMVSLWLLGVSPWLAIGAYAVPVDSLELHIVSPKRIL